MMNILTQAGAEQGVDKLVAKLGEITTRIESKAVIWECVLYLFMKCELE